MSAASELERGIELYSKGEFFAAHEAWENVWRSALGAERDAAKALIQICVAMIKQAQGRPRGVELALSKAIAGLDHAITADPFALNIDLAAVRDALDKMSSEPITPPHLPRVGR